MRCAICDIDFDIPDDALEIRRFHGRVIYRFANGNIHAFRIGPGKSAAVAVQVEVVLPKEIVPKLPAQTASAEPQEVIPVPDKAVDQQIEDKDVESLTPMQLAFRKAFGRSRKR